MIRRNNIWRFLEIVPGVVTWLTLFLPIAASFFWPAGVATFVLVFDLYWLYKSILMGYHLVSGYYHYRRDLKIDWLKKCRSLKKDPSFLNCQDIYQAIIFATYKEEIDTLMPSFEAILNSDFPKKRIIVVLATERRDYLRAQKNAQILTKAFGKKFFKFLVTVHSDIPGEVKAKGANVRWAGKILQKYITFQKIPLENVIVTTCDADSRLHPKYLSSLTYHYATNPNRIHRSFQPIPLYSNNIWQAPPFSRIIAFGNSFWQLIEATRPWRLINFSTHAMSLKTLVEMDFWDTTVVNEDSRQFWRAYFKFNGDHEVVPIFIPVYMDAVLAENFWQTLKNQYLQKRRWFYGVEHFPYVVTQSLEKKQIALLDRLVKIYRLFEANYSIATASIYLAVIGWLPIVFGPGFRETVLAQNLPIIIRGLLGFTWLGLVTSMIISTLLLPPRPQGFRKRKYLEMISQWILIPITAIFFSSIPAIDAQTRLMFGKYMTFRVTQKKVISQTA
ncbi:MAG: glycosyltransferase family 2 protein [Patescibacteria group bacterium]